MIRVLIWATHLQTDILALTSYLDQCPDVALLIVTPHADVFLQEPFAKARPFAAELLDRNHPDTTARVRAFKADVAVADNHIPPKGHAPRLFYMWHGMGWKARSRLDLKVFYHQVRQLTGIDPRRPNPNFMAQCYGPTDLAWRVENWGLPDSSCARIGMTFSDLLLDPPYDKQALASHYKIDVIGRKTVLLSITWHYGGIFARPASIRRTLSGLFRRRLVNTDDLGFLRRMIETVRSRQANLLICMHDRQRYDPNFLTSVAALADAHPFVEIRFKDEHPDNMTDLLVADVMVSNLSSFLAYHYLLRRPSVHILPAPADTIRIERMVMLLSRIRVRGWFRSEAAWMLAPSDTGGVVVIDSEEAAAAVESALDDPSSGVAATGRWLDRHIARIDGRAAARFKAYLEQLCGDASSEGRGMIAAMQIPET